MCKYSIPLFNLLKPSFFCALSTTICLHTVIFGHSLTSHIHGWLTYARPEWPTRVTNHCWPTMQTHLMVYQKATVGQPKFEVLNISNLSVKIVLTSYKVLVRWSSILSIMVLVLCIWEFASVGDVYLNTMSENYGFPFLQQIKFVGAMESQQGGCEEMQTWCGSIQQPTLSHWCLSVGCTGGSGVDSRWFIHYKSTSEFKSIVREMFLPEDPIGTCHIHLVWQSRGGWCCW